MPEPAHSTAAEPLSDDQLAGIAAELERPGPTTFTRAEVRALVDEIGRLRGKLEPHTTSVPLLLDRADLDELALILIAERYRLDKGDDRPVPQPRWAANVRISQAVNAALAAAWRDSEA